MSAWDAENNQILKAIYRDVKSLLQEKEEIKKENNMENMSIEKLIRQTIERAIDLNNQNMLKDEAVDGLVGIENIIRNGIQPHTEWVLKRMIQLYAERIE